MENKSRIRKTRVAKRIKSFSSYPRLSVFRSARHIYAQIIDNGKILVSAKDLGLGEKLTKTQKASYVGEKIAKSAISKKIKHVVFDRGAYKYHGRVKALADGARKGGLKF